MNQLRRLALVISISTVLAGTALAGETSSPPCFNPGNPGETSSPPCSSQRDTDEARETITRSSNEAQVFVLEATTYLIETLLTVF